METPKPSSERAFPFLKTLLLTTTGGITLIVILAVVGVWQTGNRLLAGINAVFNAPPTEPKIEVPTVVINQIQGASELTTAVFTMEAVVPTAQERKLGEMVVATTELLYIARGEVRAGVDLESLTPEDIDIEDQTVQVQLPPPEILDSKIDVEQSKVYRYDRGFLNLGPDVAPQLQTLAQRQTLQKIVKSACSEGILTEASDRAALAITGLLQTAGYEKVEVQTTPPVSGACSGTTALALPK